MIKNLFLKLLIAFFIGSTLGILISQWHFNKEFYSPIYLIQELKTEEELDQTEQDWFSKSYSKKKVEIDLSQQKLFLFGDGELIKEMPVSTGEKESPTPIGSFRVIYKSVMVYSKIADCWLPFWVGFTDDGQYGFHELPLCGQERTGQEEIGVPSSLGCIRLDIENAQNFYNWADINTEVRIY